MVKSEYMSSNRHQCLGLGEKNRFCQERVWDRWVGEAEKVEEAVGKHQQFAIYKPGKVAVVLSGRQAGKKVVVIKQQDDGTKERPYPHAVVAGIERYPLKVTKNMGKKRIARRSKVKPFIKVVNYAHLLPTRYMLELESLKGSVSSETFKEPTQREDSKKAIKKAFEERYQKGQNRWFFSKLRF
ncbi:hypothetical protein LQV05_000748 [Cryptococcus neoformans]|nr:hypothetical protein LQV05_000748 [Cryptococcus neoformans]